MRHPLKELSLDAFLPLEPRTASKRPLSPAATLLSPSKRRILSAEGLYSPEKRRNSAPSRQLFSGLVEDPLSPARELDFAALSQPTPRKADLNLIQDASPRPQTPVKRVNNLPKLAPSPEIASSSASCMANNLSLCESTSDSSRNSNPPLAMRIPREMPLFADRHSIHWPGFDIHADTHISIPTSETIAYMPVPPIPAEDDTKENVRPRRRVGKKLTPDEGKTGKDIKSSRTENHAPGARGMTVMSTLDATSQNTPSSLYESAQERKRNRLMMVRELDQELNDEEDIEQQL